MTSKAYSKSKGSQFELKVLRDLREVLTAYRSIGSGNAKDESGDILTECFCIECKFHKSIRPKQVDDWFKKVCIEAELQGKEPILIYKENNREPMVVFFDNLRGTRRIWMEYSNWLEYLREQSEADD